MASLTSAQCLAAFIELLEPDTRNRHTHAGAREIITPINDNGIDVHVGEVDTAAQDPDGRAHAYLVIWPSSLPTDQRRLDGHTGNRTWRVNVTIAGGDLTRTQWAVDKIEARLERARLSPTTGLLTPVFDATNIRVDEEVTPSRHYLPLQYTTNVC